MRINYFLIAIICSMNLIYEPLIAQKNIVSSTGTLRDKFGKKLGNLMFSTATLKFGRIKNDVIISDTIRFFNSGNKTVSLAVGKVPVHLACKLTSTSIAPKHEGWMLIVFDARKKNDFGFVLDRFELVTDDSLQPKKMISITATIEESFPAMSAEDSLLAPKARCPETVFSYGSIKQGTKIIHEFTVYNDGKRDLLIQKVKSNCDCIKTGISKLIVPSGESSTLKIEFDSSGKEGSDTRKIDLYLNDYLNPDITIEMKGVIVK